MQLKNLKLTADMLSRIQALHAFVDEFGRKTLSDIKLETEH